MQIVVLKESSADEFRIALVPESVKKLGAAGNEISLETGAGETAGANVADYEQAGAKISSNRKEFNKPDAFQMLFFVTFFLIKT